MRVKKLSVLIGKKLNCRVDGSWTVGVENDDLYRIVDGDNRDKGRKYEGARKVKEVKFGRAEVK